MAEPISPPQNPIPTTPPVVPQPVPTMQPSPPKSKKSLFMLLAFLIVLLFLFVGWFVLFNKKNAKPQEVTKNPTPSTQPARVAAAIAGTITFQGYASPGAYLVIVEKTADKTEYKSVVTGLNPQNGSIPWTWSDATRGKNYDLKAQLQVAGKTIQESDLIQVSAPANAVSITLISDQQPPQPDTTSINGTIDLNGYLPAGSSLSVLSAVSGNGNTTSVVSGIAPQDNAPWTWSDALVGTTYTMSVQLKNAAGVIIGTSSTKTITAPSSNILFSVSSSAQPPAPTVTGISGTIALNGTIPANSYITLGTRPDGEATFNQIAGNIASTNGVTWNWTQAQAGTEYDVQAYLWANGKPYAQSNIVTVTAPSTFDILTINAQQPLAAPSVQTIVVNCNGQQGNLFQATIRYNTNASLQNPQQYRVVVTQASTGSQTVNTTLTPGNPLQQQTLTTGYLFTPGATYYAQYAYSVDGTTFSPLSPSAQFECN